MRAWLLARWRRLSPPALFAASFALLITGGTLGLLALPGLYTGERLSLLDALFTATSAVCVTGLIVVDTASYFTFWGQLWILLLIQLGGLGVVSLTSLIIGALGRRLSLRTEMIAVPSIQELHGHDLLRLVRGIVKFTLAFEGVLALILAVQWIPHYGVVTGLWHAVFHAVSAFCNSGFSTFSDSLIGFHDKPFVLMPISLAIIVGSFGYFSFVELYRFLRMRGFMTPQRMSTHTWAALVVTLLLLFGGAMAFLILEWSGVLDRLSVVDKIVNAWFMSATRTAGFSAVPYAQVGNEAIYLTMMLMVVGGSPGSVAGGIKTTALAVLAAMAVSRILGRRYVQLHMRAIPASTVERTASLIIMFFLLLAAVHMTLTLTETGGDSLAAERASFLPLLFEGVSAAGTVGLSMDVTPTLSPLGKLAIIGTMFIGRVGPLAFFAAISIKSTHLPGTYRPAREELIVG